MRDREASGSSAEVVTSAQIARKRATVEGLSK
jgi:hypothetical protein